MKNEEAVAALQATNTTLVKIGTETQTLLDLIGTLKEAATNVDPAVADAIAAVDAQAHVVDDLVPDAPPPPP